MQCPNCIDSTLAMSVREGVEIDYCPQCRGVWLDRGELDKLLDRAAGPAAASHITAEPPMQRPQLQQPAQPHPGFVDSDYPRNTGYGGKRKKSWLSDIFD